MAQSTYYHAPSNNLLLPRWLIFGLLASAVISTISVSFFSFFVFQAIISRPLNPIERAASGVANIDLGLDQDSGLSLEHIKGVPTVERIGGLSDADLALDTEERITILVMGIDRRPGEPFISRTDSMMLFSYNPKTEKAAVLSIPRDLYVLIPNRGRDRINTAFVYGSAGGNPQGGAELAMQTIQYNLGITVHHYALVDFGAVIETVDLLGGIDVHVPFTIDDPTFPNMNYGYDPLYIPAGAQHFDGETALKYARTRHVDSDFGRAARQQQVVFAMRDKYFSLGVTEMLFKTRDLYRQIESGVRTDMSLTQITRLITTMSDVPPENIESDVLGPGYVVNYRTEQGASVLLLVKETAEPRIAELFHH